MLVSGERLEVLISPTTRCNLRCRYCYVAGESGGKPCDMTLEDMRRAFAWLRDYLDLVRVSGIRFTWFGGEPLLLGADYLRAALEIQARELSGIGFVNCIQSNLVCDIEPFTDLFAEYFHASVGFSYDVNGDFRLGTDGKSRSGDVLRNVRRLTACGITLGAVSTLTRADIGKGRRIYEAFKALGVRFRVNRAASSPRLRAEGLQLTPEEYEDIVRDIAECYFADGENPVGFHNMDLMTRAYLGARALPCVDTLHPEKYIGLEAGGRILPRCRFQPQVGNYLTDAPRTVFARLRNEASAYTRPGRCTGCEFWGRVCTGGCHGERDCDCLASDCGYRTETTCGIWRYVAEKVRELGLSYGAYAEEVG